MIAAMRNAVPSAADDLLYGKAQGKGCVLFFKNESSLHYEASLAEIINTICLQHGSSLSGRAASFRYWIGNVYKPCILLDEKSEAILIPTAPLQRDGAMVISYNEIEKCLKNGKAIQISFKSGTVIDVPVSYRSFAEQMKRCEQYLREIDHRKS